MIFGLFDWIKRGIGCGTVLLEGTATIPYGIFEKQQTEDLSSPARVTRLPVPAIKPAQTWVRMTSGLCGGMRRGINYGIRHSEAAASTGPSRWNKQSAAGG